MARNDGMRFQTEMHNSWLYLKETVAPTLVVRRIHDTRDFLRLSKKITMPRQAADEYVIYDGRFIQFEYKSSVNKTSFVLERWDGKRRRCEPTIKEHQYREAFATRAAGGESWFVINKRVPYHNEAYVIHPTVMWEIEDSVRCAKKRSVRWDVLKSVAEYNLQILNKKTNAKAKKYKSKIWDVKEIIGVKN